MTVNVMKTETAEAIVSAVKEKTGISSTVKLSDVARLLTDMQGGGSINFVKSGKLTIDTDTKGSVAIVSNSDIGFYPTILTVVKDVDEKQINSLVKLTILTHPTEAIRYTNYHNYSGSYTNMKDGRTSATSKWLYGDGYKLDKSIYIENDVWYMYADPTNSPVFPAGEYTWYAINF